MVIAPDVSRARDRRQSRMRVLLVGGEDHHLRIPYMKLMLDKGFEVIASGSGPDTAFRLAKIPFFGVTFSRSMNPIADFRALFEFRALMSVLAPDIVHSFDTKPNLLIPLAAQSRRNVKAVRTINGLGWTFSSPSISAKLLQPLYRTLQSLVSRFCTATVFQNRDDFDLFNQHELVRGGLQYLISGSGVDTAPFQPDQRAREQGQELRRALGLSDHRIAITVSRITREKGIGSLLAAAAKLRHQYPQLKFLLVGSRANERSSAISEAVLAAHSENVLALGQREDVPALLAMADLFVFPSEYREGVPRALMEAALSRLPIVATRIPGVTDIIRDGDTGLLVPPRSPDALAAAITRLIEDERLATELGRRAAQFVVQGGFSLEDVCRRYAAVYHACQEHTPGTVKTISIGA